MVKMALLKIVLCCVIVLSVLYQAYSQAFYNQGKCPDNHKVGDKWREAGSCIQCTCDHGGYGCTGCGLIAPIPPCQVVTNETAPYPNCCPRIECPSVG